MTGPSKLIAEPCGGSDPESAASLLAKAYTKETEQSVSEM